MHRATEILSSHLLVYILPTLLSLRSGVWANIYRNESSSDNKVTVSKNYKLVGNCVGDIQALATSGAVGTCNK